MSLYSHAHTHTHKPRHIYSHTLTHPHTYSHILPHTYTHSFSNRVFIDKAVSAWTGKSDLVHLGTVGDYIHFSKGFLDDSLKAYDLTQNSNGDPLYAVQATKRGK